MEIFKSFDDIPVGNGIVYIIENKMGKTYVGWSNNPKRRIRQHNGEIKGGARRTKRLHCGSWNFKYMVCSHIQKQEFVNFIRPNSFFYLNLIFDELILY